MGVITLKKLVLCFGFLVVFVVNLFAVSVSAAEIVEDSLTNYDGYYVSSVDGADQTETNLSAGQWPREFRTEYTNFNRVYTVVGYGSNNVSIPANRNVLFACEVPELVGTVLYEHFIVVLRGYDANGKSANFSLTVDLSDYSLSHKDGGFMLSKVFSDGSISYEWKGSPGSGSFLAITGITSVEITKIEIFANCSSGNTTGYLQASFIDPMYFGWMYVDEEILPAPVEGGDAMSGIGQALQALIGWVGHVLPVVKEYPGFIMIIAVPLFVGIVTWVTTIYKRRRG